MTKTGLAYDGDKLIRGTDSRYNIGFMAYGTLGFGLLTGVFTPDHTFEDGDRRRRGGAFGLPLFQQE